MPRGQRNGNHHTSEEAEKTRRTILRTAQQLFMEQGYRAVSTRQLADACGLTQPALYHYFSDKEELYVAMVQEEVGKMRTALERIARRNEPVAERLRRIVVYLLSSSPYDLALMQHDIRHELTDTGQKILHEAFDTGIIAPIVTVFADAIQTGLLRDQQAGGIDAYTTTYLFMSMISPFVTRWHHHETSKGQVMSDTGVARMLVRVLLHGLAGEHEAD